MNINIYTVEVPTHAILMVVHDAVQYSTIVRIDEGEAVTMIRHVDHDALPRFLTEYQATPLVVDQKDGLDPQMEAYFGLLKQEQDDKREIDTRCALFSTRYPRR